MDNNRNYMDDNYNDKNFETEINWRKIFKNPFKWPPLYFIVFLVLIIYGGSYYVLHFDQIYENMIAPVADTTANEATEKIVMKKASMSAGLDINLYYTPSDSLVARGKKLYDANCFACHGMKGDGKGPAGMALKPKPRNFTSDKDWINGRRIVDIFKTLKDGIPNSAMLAYGFMPVPDRFALIHYVRSFARDYPKSTPKEIAMADSIYMISQGDSVAAQIPVALAIEKEIAEYSDTKANVDDMLEQVGSFNDNAGAKIFDLVSIDKRKSLEVLSRSSVWRNDSTDFVDIITANLVDNGFSSAASRLTSQQWSTLHTFLAGLFAE